jgi:hypothetical protein
VLRLHFESLKVRPRDQLKFEELDCLLESSSDRRRWFAQLDCGTFINESLETSSLRTEEKHPFGSSPRTMLETFLVLTARRLLLRIFCLAFSSRSRRSNCTAPNLFDTGCQPHHG